MKDLKTELLAKFEAMLELYCEEETTNIECNVTIGEFECELEIHDAKLAYKNDYHFCGEFKGCQKKESEHKFEFSCLYVKRVWDITSEEFMCKTEVEEMNNLFNNIYTM